jgi:hypothetical protein
MPPRRAKRDDIAVKIDATIYHKARVIASYRHVPLAAYLSEMLQKPVDRDYLKIQEQMGKEQERPEEQP